MTPESRILDLFRWTPRLREELLSKLEVGELQEVEQAGVGRDELKGFLERMLRSRGLESLPLDSPRARALEAIVRRYGRPVLLIQNDTYTAPELSSVLQQLEPHRQRIEAAIKSVGRVDFVNHPVPWGGTGWLVDENVVITNRHVAEIVAESIGNGKYRFRLSVAGVPFGARLDLRAEFGQTVAPFEFELTSVKFIARSDQPDLALLGLEVDGKLPPPVELLEQPGAEGQPIGIIGYPAYDSRNDPQDIARYFGSVFDVKRLAPGIVSQMAGKQHFFMHDATTLGGNSGSIVLDLESGRAMGLHFAGTYLTGNYAVTAGEVKKALSGLSATVIVPAEMASVVDRPDGKHPAAYFAGRTGYNSGFLGRGKHVPLLGLGKHACDAAEPVEPVATSGKFLLYTHFSVAVSSTRRMPIFTAVNIDAGRTKKIKRAEDRWFIDGRLPADVQLQQKDYRTREISRGHMVRREDPNWGPLEVAHRANDDTFHYTNAAPQHFRLNQGKAQWLGLEEYILSNAKTRGLRISVFTGPILRSNDPILPDGVQVPEEFWKVVVGVDEDSGAIRCSGYVLSQGRLIGDITESFVFGEYRTYQLPVGTLAGASGLDFGLLVAADVLNRTPLPEAAPGLPRIIPLDRLEDMVL